MVAKIDETMTFDDMEEEVIYTRAALEADPDARDLLAQTDDWMPWIDGARSRARDARVAVTRASAQRRVSNGRLDSGCKRFGNDLLNDLGQNTSAARWGTFFSGKVSTVSSFTRQPFGTQIAQVKAWLSHTGDAVLERYRAELTEWSAAGSAALAATAETRQVRGDAAVARETVAEDLTRSRDGLEAALTVRANERGLPRDWPEMFFRTRRRARSKPEEEVTKP